MVFLEESEGLILGEGSCGEGCEEMLGSYRACEGSLA